MTAATRAIEPDRPKPDDWAVQEDGSKYGDALAAMRDRAFCGSERYSEQQGRADRTLAHPDILEFERKFIKRAFMLGIPMFPHCIVRGADDQNRLFVQGRSKARAGESAHNFGAAVDLVHGTKGWDLTRKQWSILGHIGKEIAASAGLKVTWGGDWQFYDPAHWELTEWKSIRQKMSDAKQWLGG